MTCEGNHLCHTVLLLGSAVVITESIPEGTMFRRAVLLLLLPMAGLVAQSTPVHLTITASNDAVFRLVRVTRDSSSSILARGRAVITWEPASREGLTVFAGDSSGRVHVEATQANRVLAGGDGAFVVIRQDTDFVSIEARSRAPASVPAAVFRKP